jgi:quercetin dioxygenase-like cupin family protein
MIERGTVLRNDFNGEVFIFSGSLDDRDVARFECILSAGGSNGGGLVHFHPCADEEFIVRSGSLRMVVEGRHHVLRAGQRIVVPRGKPHWFSAEGGSVTFVTEFRPARQYLRFFANFGLLSQRRKEWFSAKGDPNLLLIALVLDSYRDHLYLAGPPVFLQKLAFAALAPIARLAGYRLEIGPM